MEIKKYENPTNNNLRKVEKRVVEKQEQNPISKESKEKVIKSIAAIIDGAKVDFGLKLPGGEKYVATRLYQILIKYYSDLRLSEIKDAFELTLTGELDLYFKKKANGYPDKEHYGTLSIEFVGKILNAYREFKRNTNQKTQKAIEQKRELTSDEKKKLWDRKFKTLYDNFLLYKDYKKRKENDEVKADESLNFTWLIPHIYIQILSDMNMPIEIPKNFKRDAIYEAWSGKGNWQRKNKAIKDCFDEIIERQIDFRGELEKYYNENSHE